MRVTGERVSGREAEKVRERVRGGERGRGMTGESEKERQKKRQWK